MNKVLKAALAAATTMSLFLSNTSLSGVSAASSLLGDLNGDGYRNSTDVMILNNFIHGKVYLSNLGAADVDYDGVISRADKDRLAACNANIINLPTNVGNFSLNANNHLRRYTVHNYQNNSTTSYLLRSPMTQASSTNTYSNILDNRVPATDSSVVQITFNGGKGTGFIVDEHIIATAAHCVYDRNTSSFKANLKAYIGGVSAANAVELNAVEAHVPDSYINTTNGLQMDYALIYVEEDLSQYGMFDLGYPSDQFMDSEATVTVRGYPGYVNGSYANNQLYTSTGIIHNLNDYDGTLFDFQVMTDAYGSSGDSGGPIYMTTFFGGNEYRVVVGIFTSCYDNEADTYMGFGTRITQPLLRFYYNNDQIGCTIS